MKKTAFSTLFTLFLILSIAILAEAGTARFPVEVKWDASGHGQVEYRYLSRQLEKYSG